MKVYSYSWLMVSYILNEYEAQEENMKYYLQKADLILVFYSFNI